MHSVARPKMGNRNLKDTSKGDLKRNRELVRLREKKIFSRHAFQM